jgi:beta-aspartyl-peptidase (threonine type)
VGGIARGSLTPEQDAGRRAALARALDAGGAVLARGGPALDAVEAAVRVLEDDPAFNAGRGAVLTWDGAVSLDAAIMEGATRRAGAVAGVTTTRNPVSLARAVMEKSPHVLLAGPGADAFARAQGAPQEAPEWFVTPERRAELERVKREGTFDGRKLGTVGAVARDARGHVAAATSTGGITAKRWGRVGDAPIPGAGTWAEESGCAVSATGSGEIFLRLGVAHEICARARLAGQPQAAAADALIKGEVGRLGGSGGVILMGREGPGGWSFSTSGMYRGRLAEGGRADVRIYGDEE